MAAVYHPTTRLLTVLEILQARQQINGHELAERLEVDERTVRRYILMLQELGIPVESRRGRYGSYRLRPGFKLPPLMLTEDEALAVELGLIIARRSGLSAAAPAVEGALAKIERVLPVAVRERVQAVQETLVLASSRSTVATDGTFITTIGTATSQHRRVWMRYRAWSGEETERVFDPYGLLHREGFWYTAGFCHLRRAIRVFRLDRMLAVEPHDSTFTPPADFDLLAHVERAIALTPATWPVEVVLQTTLADARRWISPTTATLEATPDGVVMRCYTEDLQWMARTLASLPCSFVVRQPDVLLDELRAVARHLLALADDASSCTPEDAAARG
jgi:predicted DNA-binding transcriptional regulator YafY